MTLPRPPPLGFPVPNSRHAISVQLPTWQDMRDFALGNSRVKDVQQTGYPRSFIHKDIETVADACVRCFASSNEKCLLFPSFESASACRNFVVSPNREENILPPELIWLQAIAFGNSRVDRFEAQNSLESSTPAMCLYAVFYPASRMKQAMTFWRLTGLGVSSRMAEQCLKGLANIRQYMESDDVGLFHRQDRSAAHDVVRQRVVTLLKRSPIEPERLTSLEIDDVYLHQSGMATIYNVHQTLLSWRGGRSIIFGFTYELTPKVLETYGPGLRFYGFGTDEELADLESFLEEQSKNLTKVQALWCECPSNPLLRTPNLKRLRALADKHHFPLIIDETIGSFANVDVMNVADILVTSLTKSFSGYADVMGGSAVLNPSMPHYSELKRLFQSQHWNDLYVGDTTQLELNSRSFLVRTKRTNDTAQRLVDFFQGWKAGGRSSITAVYYPSLCWSVDNYQAHMRLPTEEFTAGYGALFTIEFENVEKARVFFDSAAVHKGPSLGASMTLLQPYVQTVFHQEKEWAARYGLEETIVRVAVGLEDPDELLRTFKNAMLKADEDLGLKAGASGHLYPQTSASKL